MSLPVWAALPIGLALVLVALFDVFMTVLHVQVESPISSTLNRKFWRRLIWLTRRLPRRARNEILGSGMPLMIVGTVVFWMLLYVVGFALLYSPAIGNADVFSVREGADTFSINDALYFSAVSFFTLGYGDVVALHPLARLGGVVEGACGLLTVSLSVTYLLSVYPLITRKLTLAASLNEEMAGRSDGAVLAARYVATGHLDALGDRLRGLHDELLYLGLSHGFYPVLYYVRPREVHLSFVRLLALLQGIVATLRYGLDRVEHRDVVTDPRLLVLEEGLIYTLNMLGASIHLDPNDPGDGDHDGSFDDFSALIQGLQGSGVTAASSGDRDAAEGHARFRSTTDRFIRAYAENVGYTPEEVRATYSRQDRASALIFPLDAAPDASPSPRMTTTIGEETPEAPGNALPK